MAHRAPHTAHLRTRRMSRPLYRIVIRSSDRARAVALGALLAALLGAAPPGPTPSGREVMERMNHAYYYPGRDMVADVRMEIAERTGLVRLRTLTVMRLNLPRGEQRYLVYFHQPGDVRRMSCMVYKHVGGGDERWMFMPAIGEIQRITAPERSRFLGSDFVREEFSGRDAAADSHTVIRGEVRDGRSCWVVESVPISPTEFSRMMSWVDRETWLPIRQEFYGTQGQLVRTFTAGRIEEVRDSDGGTHPTILERTMAGRVATVQTRMIYTNVRYGVGLRESDFSDDHLKVPMETWFRAKP